MKGGKDFAMKGANQTDSKLSVRKGGGKAANGPTRPFTPFPPRKRPADGPVQIKFPRTPLSDVLVFYYTTFKKKFMENLPNTALNIAACHREVHVEWETMSDADKAPYVEIAKKEREEFEKAYEEYEERQSAANKEYMERLHANKIQPAEKAREELQKSLAGLIIRE